MPRQCRLALFADARHRVGDRRTTLATRSHIDGAPPAGPPALLGGIRLARNTAFSVGQQTVAMALALVLIPYMLWALGPERYGLWLTLQVFNLLGLAYLAELGFQGAIVRSLARHFIAEDHEGFRAVLAGGFWLFCAIGMLMGSAVILFAQSGFVAAFPIPPDAHGEMRLALTIIGVGLFAGFPGLVLKAYFAGRQELATTKVWELADRVLFSVAIVVALQFTSSLVVLVLLEQAIALGLMLIFALHAGLAGKGWFSVSPRLAMAGARMGQFGEVVRMSRSVFAINLTSQGIIRLPEVFVGAVLGPVSLTAYQIATRIPRAIKTLQGALNAAVLPHIAALDAADGPQARAAFALSGLRANYLVATPLLLTAGLFAPVLLSLWVGAEYRPLAGYAAAFAAFQLLFLASNFCTATLVHQAHLRGFVRWNLALVAAFLVALAFGLESFGLSFLFASLLIVGVAMVAGVAWTFHRAHSVGPLELARVALAGPVLVSATIGAGLLTVPAMLLSESLWIGGSCALAGGLCLYAAALWALVLTADERARLRTVWKRVTRR